MNVQVVMVDEMYYLIIMVQYPSTTVMVQVEISEKLVKFVNISMFISIFYQSKGNEEFLNS